MDEDGTFIFVVGTDPAVLHSLEFFLTVSGFKVRIYRDEASFLQTTVWPTRGCLVVEQNMPNIKGIALVEALKRRAVVLPAIVTASDPTAELRQHAAEAGAVAVLGKPIQHQLLLKTIHAALAA